MGKKKTKKDLGLDPRKVRAFIEGFENHGRAKKSQPTSSQVHVPAMGDEELRKAAHNRKNIEDLMQELQSVADHLKTFFHEEEDEVDKEDDDEDTRQVGKVAVIHDGKVLMGVRSDNQKWDFPGGRIKDGEEVITGAIRETAEETGLVLSEDQMSEIGVDNNERAEVHVFLVNLDKEPEETDLHDRDDEFDELAWVDIATGLPQEVEDNLHTPRDHNAVLNALASSEDSQKSAEVDVDADPDLYPGINNQEGGALKADEERPDYNWELDNMQEVVNGMDYELAQGNVDDTYAMELAVMNLTQDPNYYKKKRLSQEWTDDSLAKKDTGQTEQSQFSNEGYNIDLGSGNAREPGYIGFDLYPYDYGTVIHDLNTGIPMPTGSVKNVRMSHVHGHEHMPDVKGLLSEVHRVLMPGGNFVYEGPEDIYNYPEWETDYPGLVMTNHEETGVAKARAVPGVRQQFTRVAVPDPATANDAEPRIGIAQFDMLPADALLAMDAVGYFYSDATSSGRGNRLMGYPSQGGLLNKDRVGKSEVRKKIPICKLDKHKQIMYCVALEPNEVDSQEDFMDPEEIEKTAHGYMQTSRVIGSGHEKPIDAFPVESYLAPQDLDFEGQNGPQRVKQGSWILGIKINDPEEWSKVLSGEYTGISVGGKGLRDEVGSTPE